MLLVGIVQPCFSQEQFVAPPTRLITKFPFKILTGGIVIIQALLTGHDDTLHFVLDTGSGGISLDSATVAYLKLKETPSDRTIRGIAGVRKVNFVMHQQMRLPGLTVDSLNFHINDYELLTSVYGEKIDGIIGYSLFSRYIVKLDYDKLIMEIWQNGSIRYPRGGFLLKPLINNIPVFGARINDNHPVSARFYFDSGAGLCILMSEDFNRDSAILKKGKKITVTQAEGIGGKKQMKITTVKELRFGPYRFRKVPAYIFSDDYNVTAYPQLGGLIGNDILRRFNVIVNYAAKEIHLTPNTHYNEAFDYSYTGLGIYLVDNEVLVEDVIEHSPGAVAGFKPGDIIIAVESNFSKNIQAYKALLQRPGAKLKVMVMREAEILMLNLVVKSIL
ncbi:signal protein PDZ [Segetibacter sp. 3557_3]|nr:signal protein PDZ [Segetibacter sp. 3557_3]